MRRTPALLFVLTLATAGSAQSFLTVDQFEQLLVKLQHDRDGAAAEHIAGVTLSQRAGSADLDRWLSQFKGERARQALTAVADASATLDPPPSAIPSAAPPTAGAQHEILSHVFDYVHQTLPRLPDFLALRTTTRFEISTPEQLRKQDEISALYLLNAWQPKYRNLGPAGDGSLYFVGVWQYKVAYRDGEEVSELPTGTNQHPPPLGLESKGEFGPILGTVFGDAQNGSIEWSRWEQGVTGLLTVFHYRVPREMSHYLVENAETRQSDHPAYHGEFAVDPSTGAIFRITVVAEPTPNGSDGAASIFLEYGPVVIGGVTYICPLHGVAYSTTPAAAMSPSANAAAHAALRKIPPQTYINDFSFTQYHRFRSETRILTGNPSP